MEAEQHIGNESPACPMKIGLLLTCYYVDHINGVTNRGLSVSTMPQVRRAGTH